MRPHISSGGIVGHYPSTNRKYLEVCKGDEDQGWGSRGLDECARWIYGESGSENHVTHSTWLR